MYKFLVVSAIALEVWLISSQLDSPAWAQDHQEQFINLQTTVQSLEMIAEGDRPLLLATPSQFNPNLREPDPIPAPVQEFIVPPKVEPTFTDYAVLDNLKLNFQNYADNEGQHNQIIEPTWQWRFKDGTVFSFQTGFNSFDTANKASVRNVPLQFGVTTKLGSLTLDTHAGIDIYDRLPTTVNFDVTASLPVLSGVTISGFFEQKPYKFSADSLNNQISTRRFGPNIYWQIDPDTSLFSRYRWGNYNDGNNEQQSYSRLERKFGQFAIAGNLFVWFYDREAAKNSYFSPPDFLVYSGEISWEGDVFNTLKCRLAANLGEQRLNNAFSPARGYQARCTVKVSPNIEADLGYNYSTVRNTSSTSEPFTSETLSGQLRVKF